MPVWQLGYWNTREWRYLSGASSHGVNTGSDYFHSTYIDLVISGLLGVRAERADATRPEHILLRASPLVPEGVADYWAIDGIRAGGHDVAVMWDRDGARYGRGGGMQLLVDGATVASRADVGELSVWLPLWRDALTCRARK